MKVYLFIIHHTTLLLICLWIDNPVCAQGTYRLIHAVNIEQSPPPENHRIQVLFQVNDSEDAEMEQETQSLPALNFEDLVEKSAKAMAFKYNCDTQIIKSYWNMICEYQYDIGIPAPVIMAIGLNESTFKSPLFLLTHNPFGIKGTDAWDGPTFPTWKDGETSDFRMYFSVKESVMDFGSYIHSREWYIDAVNCPFDNFSCIVDGLKGSETEPGYATDPDWGDKILRLIRENDLEQFCRR